MCDFPPHLLSTCIVLDSILYPSFLNRHILEAEGDCLEYFKELELDSNEASKFYDWYEQTGWKLKGGNLIKDWKATARNWKRRTKIQNNEKRTKGFNKGNFDANTLERFVTEG